MELFITLPTGERIEVENSISIFLDEKIKLSSESKFRITGDDPIQIKNFGRSSEVSIPTTGHYRIRIHQGDHARWINIRVSGEVVEATMLNIKASRPVDVCK